MRNEGHIKEDESGTYEFSYVWFSDLVETAKITQVKVQYMDGSIKPITNAKQITMSGEHYSLLFESK